MSYTLVQLATRLARRLKERDIFTMPADDALEILDSVNSSITEFVALAPSIYRLKTDGIHMNLKAPQVIQVGVTQGSTAITGLSDSLIGNTVMVSGDPYWNKLVSSNTLEMPYAGTTGTISATVYNDCVPLPSNFARFAGDPMITETGKHYRGLQRVNEHENRFWGEPSVGFPNRFVVETGGQAAGGSPFFSIRVLPLPFMPVILKCSMEVRPAQFILSDLVGGGAVLPFADEHIVSILMPMCFSRLVTGPLWPKDSDPKKVDTALAQAMRLLGMIATDAGPGLNRIGTPWGY